jgi:TPR repeat protein
MHNRSTFPVLWVVLIAAAPGFARGQPSHECPTDDTEFAKVQQRAADRDPAAQTALAFCYDLGRHVQPSRAENMRWLTEAAKQGYAPAEYELGRIYLYGRGVPSNYSKALLWERKAADQGDPRAQRDLALIYERGFGVKTNSQEAAAWNRKAAAQGQPDAQLQLAQALENGAGVRKNSNEARSWYAAAAKNDQRLAQLHLARIYSKDSDCRRSIHWYKEAAAGGESQAMYELGKLYLKQECGEDRERAFQWLVIGARFGSLESKIEADNLGPRLSQTQENRATLQAERWIASHSGAQKAEEEKEREEH